MSSNVSHPPDSVAETLQQLRSDHALYEAHIEALNRQVYLSIREQSEHRRLKKLKLAIKDRIARLEGR
jgi:hypothetical protein